jgi:hypothetical protein
VSAEVNPDGRRSASPIIAAVLLLLPVLYVQSYLAIVKPGPGFDWGSVLRQTFRVADVASVVVATG